MIRTLTRVAALLVLATVLGGCAWQDADRNLHNAEKLRVGMNKEEVLAIMGPPQQNEVYTKPDLWFYYTQPNWIDGLVTEDECTPLVFKDGKLIGWGNEYYARSKVLRAQGKDE